MAEQTRQLICLSCSYRKFDWFFRFLGQATKKYIKQNTNNILLTLTNEAVKFHGTCALETTH